MKIRKQKTDNLTNDLHKIILKLATKYKLNIYDAFIVLGYVLESRRDFYKEAKEL